MLKKYVDYIDHHLKPEHYQKMTLAVILFCLLTILLGPPQGLSSLGQDNAQANKASTGSFEKKIVFEQIPPPEPPVYVKD